MKNSSSYGANTGVLLNEKSILNKTADNKSFSEFIKEKRKLESSPSGKKNISTRELADRLGIDYEQFRKIVNMNKPTKKRDCIIAICAALRLDSEETDEALILYRYMPVLNDNNPRDYLLMEILEEQFTNPLTISAINQRLARNGYPELDIIDHRPSVKPASKKNDAAFKLLKKQSRIFSDDLIVGDQYDSLGSEYSLSRYRCVAEMWLDDVKKKKIYHLTSDTHHFYHMEISGKDYYDIKSFNNTEESGAFQDYFFELEGMANHELKKMYAILNDTRNYQTRISAKILNDMLYVYAETYNYTVPELSEYYMFEYKNGKSLLSVYKNSEFMRCYLNPDEYSATYGKNSNTLVAQYNSIEEIKSQRTSYESELLLNCRIRFFNGLKEKVDTLKSDLKSNLCYIRRLDYIYDDHDRVCQFFGVDKEFECTLDSRKEFMSAGRDSYDFHFEDCGKVHITLNDLYTAFKLGFNNVNEICRVKKRLGSIENIIE